MYLHFLSLTTEMAQVFHIHCCCRQGGVRLFMRVDETATQIATVLTQCSRDNRFQPQKELNIIALVGTHHIQFGEDGCFGWGQRSLSQPWQVLCWESASWWQPHSTWWRHQMETFSALLDICGGNSPVTGEFPTQRPVTRSFNVFFDLLLNKRLSKQS